MASRAALAHIVDWDVEHNRPIVDGKITPPTTGDIVPRGKLATPGPPGVSIHILNMSEGGNVRSISQVCWVPIDKAFLEIAGHVRAGTYKLVSVNATEYSLVVVCEVLVEDEEFERAWEEKLREALR